MLGPSLFAIAQPAGYFVRCGLFDLTLLGNELSFPDVSFTITKQKLTDKTKAHRRRNPLKLKCLAVITLLVLGCYAASAQGSGTATLGFTSAGDLELYCNFEEIQWGGPNSFYFQGVDNVQTACLTANNATILGNRVQISAGDGAPVNNGITYSYADNIYDAFSNVYTGLQWYVITQIKPSGRICILPCTKHYGWVGYLGIDGLEFLGNYGYLSKSTPAANEAKMPVKSISNAGAAKEAQAKLTRTIPK